MPTFESLAFYRGMSQNHPIDKPSIVIPRRNRRPRNSGTTFHTHADQWFASRFGVPYRSQGVFVTARPETALTYAASSAHVMRVVPISNYTYCWSPKIPDLLFAATDLANAQPNAIGTFLDDAGYLDKGLEEAHREGHEVMLYCERYLAIPIGLLGVTIDPQQSMIIIPAEF